MLVYMIEGLLLNLFAQAIWEIWLSPVLRGSETPTLGEPQPPGPHQTHQTRYGNTARLAAERLTAIGGLTDKEDELADFLLSHEIGTLLRNLYVFRLDASEAQAVDEARKEFVALWEQSPLNSLGAEAGTEAFDALLAAAEDTLSTAVREGILSAHESRSNARHQLMLQRLDAMERRIQLMVGASPIDTSAVERFEADFRREVCHRHAFITPPDFYSASRVDIDRLYVMPRLVPKGLQDSGLHEHLSVEAWLVTLQHAVVLGDPGGGKSTLAAKLCHALADTDAGWTISGSMRMPIMVTLREYSAVNKDKGFSILAYMEYVAESRYQLDVPSDAMEYLLLSGRMVVIFDGLDELLETHHRQEIRNDVESFQRRFPDTAIIVTSRAVGYEQAPLDETVFDTASLGQFTDEQVNEYAHKWFSFDEDLVPTEQEETANAFVEESRSVPDLRTNPLMLALMCNFYRGQNYLPRHRPDVYEQCARMLFETWDRSRGIEPVLPIAEHIRPAMRYLASWIYEDEDRQSGAREGALIAKAVDFLLDYRFEDRHEAEHAAKAFIDFCAGRAWVFTDTGTTESGEPLFQFTHRTFLEYFTADHLVATSDSTQALSEELLPRISAREWVVVAQVAYQLKARGTLTAPDQLLSELVAHSITGTREGRINTLLFAAECLGFLVPSPPIAREVAAEIIGCALDAFHDHHDRSEISNAQSLIPALALANNEIRRPVGSTVEELLVSQCQAEGDGATLSALAIYALRSGIGMNADVFVEWQEIAGRMLSLTTLARARLALESVDLALAMAQDQELSLETLLQAHGTNCLFVGRLVPLSFDTYFGPIVDNAFSLAIQPESPEISGKGVQILEEVGIVLPKFPPPWHDRSSGLRIGYQATLSRITDELREDLPKSAMRGATLLLALRTEEEMSDPTHGPAASERLCSALKESKSGMSAAIGPILLGRLEGTGAGAAGDSLRDLEFDETQLQLLTRWMNAECDFVKGDAGDQPH